MCCVNKAMPFQFIDSNKVKSTRMGLTNHTWPISHHIVPLVINDLGGRHTDRHAHTHTHTHTRTHTHTHMHVHTHTCTHTHTHTHTHTDAGTKTFWPHMPGLKI